MKAVERSFPGVDYYAIQCDLYTCGSRKCNHLNESVVALPFFRGLFMLHTVFYIFEPCLYIIMTMMKSLKMKATEHFFQSSDALLGLFMK